MSERQRTAREEKLAVLRAKEAKEASRRKLLFTFSGVAVLAVIGLAIWIILQSGTANTNSGDKTPPVGYNAEAQLEITDTSIIIGDQAAEPVVTVFEDLMCHYCGMFEEDGGVALVDAATDGKARIEYNLVSILDGNSRDGRYSTRGGNAVMSAAIHAPEQWVEFHSALFAAQPGTGETLSDERIIEIAAGVGITDPEFIADVEAVSYGDWLTDVTNSARADGLEGTPTILLDGVQTELRTKAEWSAELGL